MTSNKARPLGIFAHLPAAFARLLPEMDTLDWAAETRAACDACVMLPEANGEAADSVWAFHAEARCCTFHPALANFLAGRALAEGGAAERVVMRRIVEGAGVSAWGIRPTEAWNELYDAAASERFGRDPSLRCPYWVGGAHACGVWAHRSATCRTWFCKHDRGLQGAAEWALLKRVLARVETLLAEYCVARGEPPGADADARAWASWYGWCADEVMRIGAADARAIADAIADETLIEARHDLVQLKRRPPRVLPDVVVPAVSNTWRDEHGVRVSGYSRYDTVIVPAGLFAFLSRLDGARTWRQAVDEANRDSGASMDESVVRELYRIGALEAPDAPDATVIRRQPWPGMATGD